jgi:hypothetical protein
VAAIRIAAVALASDNKLNFSRRGSLRMRLRIVEDDEKTASALASGLQPEGYAVTLVVTREMLAKDVWRETKRATPLDNVIDVHIAHLRRKVDSGGRLSFKPFAASVLCCARSRAGEAGPAAQWQPGRKPYQRSSTPN